jgi:fibronectin-binding autotransporter adhesin
MNTRITPMKAITIGSKSTLLRTLLLAAGSLLAVSRIQAQDQDGSWGGDSAGDWTDGTKWTDGLIANGADFTATFGNVITDNRTITLNGNRTIGNISASDTSHNYTITGNTLTLDRTSGVPTIDVISSRTLTIESIIAGNDGLQKSGGGILILKGTNTFPGGLTIKAGTVRNNNAGSGGNFLGTGGVTIGDAANTGASVALTFNGGNFTSTNPISVVGTGNASINITGWSQTLNGALTLGRNLTVTTSNAGGSSLTFGGGVTGTGNLVLQSNASTGANSSKIIFQTGSLNMTGSITNGGTGSTTTVGNIDTTISAVIDTNVTGVTQNSANSRLNLTGANTFTSNILISSGTLLANRTTASANPTSGALGNAQTPGRTASIGSGGTLRFNLGDVMGSGASSPKLTLVANGTITNSGNFFNVLGPVQLNGGTLSSVGGSSANFPSFALTGRVTVGGSAVSTISTSGTNSQIGLQSAGTTFDVADAVSGGGSDLNVTGVLANWSNATTNAGSLIKTGPGTMTLSGNNTYTGATTVNAGTLVITGSTQATSAINFGGGVLGLDIASPVTAANATVDFTGQSVLVTGTPTLASYTLFTAGSITGTRPTLAAPAPSGYELDVVGNELRLVQIGGGSAYEIWAAVNAPGSGPNEDFDLDGVPNAIEFVLGGGKDTNDLGKLPSAATDGTNMTFAFVRDRGSVDPSVSVAIEVGTDPGTWPHVFPVGADTATSHPDVTVTDNLDGTDTITLTIPKAPDTRKFARLKVVITE